MSDMSMSVGQRKPRPVIREFCYWDRVDQAREVFRYRRLNMTANEIASAIGTSPDVVRRIADESGFSVPSSYRGIWPEKDDPGIGVTNRRDPWEWSEGERRSYHWQRMTKGARELRGSPQPVPVDAVPARLPAPRIPVYYGAPINLLTPPFAKTIIQLVALRHSVSVDEIVGPRRDMAMVAIRNEAIGLVHSHCPHLSLPSIGKLFGDRDHTTILNSLARIGVKQRKNVVPANSKKPIAYVETRGAPRLSDPNQFTV